MKAKFLIYFFLFIAMIVQGQKILSLNECIKLSIENHPDMKISQLNYDLSGKQIKQAKSTALPEINANVFQSGNFGRSIDRFTNSYIDQFYNTSYAGIGFNMPLFTSMRIKNQVTAAVKNHEADAFNIEHSKNLLSLAVITAYITSLSNHEIIQNQYQQWKTDSVQFIQLQAKKEAGLSKITDEIQLQNQMKSDEIALQDAKMNYKLSLIELSQLTNMTISEEVQLVPLEVNNYIGPNQNSFDHLPQIRLAELRLKAQESTIKASKALNYPSISLSGDYGTFYASSNTERNFTQQLNDTRNGSVSLGLNIPIWRSLQTKPTIEGQKIQLEIMKSKLEKEKLEIKQSLEFATERYQTLKIKYENALKLYDIAKQNMSVLSEQKQAGLTTFIEFIIAQNNLEKYRNSATQTKYQLLLQELILQFYKNGRFEIE